MNKPKLIVVTKQYYDYNQCIEWLLGTGKITIDQKHAAWGQVCKELDLSNERYGAVMLIDHPSWAERHPIPSPTDEDFNDNYFSWIFELIWKEFDITDDVHDFIFKW